jgi:hypothetical protein
MVATQVMLNLDLTVSLLMGGEFLAVLLYWLFFFLTIMKRDDFHVGHHEFLLLLLLLFPHQFLESLHHCFV